MICSLISSINLVPAFKMARTIKHTVKGMKDTHAKGNVCNDNVLGRK